MTSQTPFEPQTASQSPLQPSPSSQQSQTSLDIPSISESQLDALLNHPVDIIYQDQHLPATPPRSVVYEDFELETNFSLDPTPSPEIRYREYTAQLKDGLTNPYPPLSDGPHPPPNENLYWVLYPDPQSHHAIMFKDIHFKIWMEKYNIHLFRIDTAQPGLDPRTLKRIVKGEEFYRRFLPRPTVDPIETPINELKDGFSFTEDCSG